MKRRVAIVVQRCHEKLVGGAEAHAWQYATLLADAYDVDVLTSTALDYIRWDNDLPAGVERRDGVTIRRFRVERGRTSYFSRLHRRVLDRFEASAGAPDEDRYGWPEALEEEFIRSQGPVCPGLYAHLRTHGEDYTAVIFLTYLYPTTFDGVRAMPHRRFGLVPTLHDEPPAYLRVIGQMARGIPRILWNTQAERRLGGRLWNRDSGNLVAMTVATEAAAPAQEGHPYLLYCGRIDVNKGCDHLLAWFAAYKAARPDSPLRLLMTGHNIMQVADDANVSVLGFVEEERKFALMAGAVAFVQPSPYESLSIVALEAMAQGTPNIVNGRCEILADHVAQSGAGFVYHDQAAFDAALDAATALDAAARASQGDRARRYVLDHYSLDQVRARLIAEVEALAANV